MDKKNGIKKILLIITLIPYFIFLIRGIFSFGYNVIEKGLFKFHLLFEPLINFWIELITEMNIILIILTVFCIGYPIYYWLESSKKNKKNAEKEVEDKQNKKLFTMFLISFIPYLFIVYSCIFGIEFGFFSNVSTYYGLEAIFLALIIGCLIPVYPIILIFQIVFTMKKYKVFSNSQKKIFKSIITILLLLLIVPSILYAIISKKDLSTNYNKDKVIIEKYLKDKYGEKNYNNMEITNPNKVSSEYKIKSFF